MDENVISEIVEHDLCIGCGMCAAVCPTQNLVIDQAKTRYAPEDTGQCRSSCRLCLMVCPFFDNNCNEDVIGESIFADVEGIRHNIYTGYDLGNYVGHVADSDWRWHSASGGVASWFLKRLLKKDHVDYVICSMPHPDPNQLFRFEILDDPEDLYHAAGSAYYPLELSQVLQTIQHTSARYAVIGLPCFIKGLRLAMMHHKKIRENMVVLAGLTCGHLVSKDMASYLTRCVGLDYTAVQKAAFRTKQDKHSNIGYCFSAETKDSDTTCMAYVGRYSQAMALNMFGLNPCRYCDDVFAELADITFMDAWLPEYSTEGRGTSIVICRSKRSQSILQEGISQNHLHLDQTDIETVIASQRDVITNKRNKLQERLYIADERNIPHPTKRVRARKPGWATRWVDQTKEKIRQTSHSALAQQKHKNATGLDVFDKQMKPLLKRWAWVLRLGALRKFASRLRAVK